MLQKVFQARQAVHQRPARLMTGGAATSSQASALTSPRSSAPQLIMASATMTKAVRSLLQDVDGFSTDFAGEQISPLVEQAHTAHYCTHLHSIDWLHLICVIDVSRCKIRKCLRQATAVRP